MVWLLLRAEEMSIHHIQDTKSAKQSEADSSNDFEWEVLIGLTEGNVLLDSVDIILEADNVEGVGVEEAEDVEEAVSGSVVAVEGVHESDHLEGEDQLHPNHLVHEQTGQEHHKDNHIEDKKGLLQILKRWGVGRWAELHSIGLDDSKVGRNWTHFIDAWIKIKC
jgi:hypothetical protein